MLNHQTILVTGGTGSFGKHFIENALIQYSDIKKLIVYSRDELKQFEMKQHHPYGKHHSIDYVIGDIRDKERLLDTCKGVDVIVHAAALKHVSIAEQNPIECIKTNVLGSENVIQAALHHGVKKVVALSTDKANAPNSIYGASKLCADKLFIHAQKKSDTTFSVVRYGNVIGASGSVIPFFLEKRKEGVIPITDPEMSRFSITPKEACSMVFFAIQNMMGGEVYIPKIPSFRIKDLAEAIAPNCKQEIIGASLGERIHEILLNNVDARQSLETNDLFIIVPASANSNLIQEYANHYRANKITKPFSYTSEHNSDWLDIETLRMLIKEHVDPHFKVI